MGGDLFARWTGSTPFRLNLSKPCSFSINRFFDEFRCRSVAAAGDSLFFCFAKSKVSKRKGDPGVCVPPLRCGHLPVLASSGVELELAALRQSLALIRLKLRSSAHSQGFWGMGWNSGSRSGCVRIDATNLIAVCAHITGATGQKHLRTRRAAWFLGSDRNFAAKHPQGAPKARRILALTPKTPDPASASDSIPHAVWQGRAAERQADQGERLSEPQASSSSTPPAASSAGNPKGPDFGSPSLCLLSLGEARESESPAAATERHRTRQRTRCSTYAKASTSQTQRHPTPC